MNYNSIILDINTIDQDKWNALVHNAWSGVPFALYEFNAATNDKAYYIVITNEANDYIAGGTFRIRGRIPLFGTFLASIWLDASALVSKDVVDENEVNYLKTAVYKSIISFAKKQKLIQINLTHWSREDNKSLLEELRFVIEENATYEVDISQNTDVIYNNLKDSNRRLIKQATKNGTETNYFCGRDALPALSDLQFLREKTQDRAIRNNNKTSMLLKSDNFLEHLLAKMENKAIIGQSFNDKKASASILLLTASDKAYYYIGGSDYEVVKNTRASNLLHWNCIQYLKEQGLKLYDLGGVPFNPSEDHPAYGVYRFKKSFGGDLKLYYSGYYVVNKYKYFFYKMILSNPALKRFINKIISR